MLEITDIAEFRKNVLHKEEMREANIGHECQSFCYMVSAEGTFDSAWTKECRGIVFDSTSGKVNGRPLHKFFNLNEREESRAENLNWSKVERVMDKRDGSMIHTVITKDGIKLKSKKTFTSDVAIAAQKLWDAHPNRAMIESWIISRNATMIFEYTAPDARIVLFYPEAELQLLHIRFNESGNYLMLDGVNIIAETLDLKVVDDVDEFWSYDSDSESFDYMKMLEAAKTREGIEGWIVQFEDGNMVKVKTEWYLKRHRAMTFIRERDIAQLVLDEGLDDMKSLLVGEGVNIQEILDIEARVLHDLRQLAHDVEFNVKADAALSRKDFALKHTSHQHFGLMMSAFIGKEPKYKEYFERNILKDSYGLRQLVLVPSVAEGD